MSLIRKPILDLDGRRFGHVVFYRLPCGLIFRTINPHTRKRILKDPRFAAFRKCSKRMAKASKIGSAIYKALPEDFRQFWMYRAFVGEALKMLKEGMTGEGAFESLFRTYAEVWHLKAEIKATGQKKPGRSSDPGKHRKAIRIHIRWKETGKASPLYNAETTVQTNIFDKQAIDYPSRIADTGPPCI